MINIEENTGTVPATSEVVPPKPTRKPNFGQRARNIAPVKKTARTKATRANKAHKGRTKAKLAKPLARSGTKTAKVLALLKRPGGAALNELLKATGWQKHSVRGFLSATVSKKLKLCVTSLMGKNGERRYSVKA